MRKIAVIAALWFASGYVLVVGINAYFGIPAFALSPFLCGLGNLILGLLSLLVLTRSPKSAHLFYNRQEEEDAGSSWIGLFWLVPPVLFLIGVVLWLRHFLHLP